MGHGVAASTRATVARWTRCVLLWLSFRQRGNKASEWGAGVPVEQCGSDSSEDLGTPTPEAVLLRVAISAHLSMISPKKGDIFLRRMAEILASEESFSAVVPIRPAPDLKLTHSARRRAMRLFQGMLPSLIARVRR